MSDELHVVWNDPKQAGQVFAEVVKPFCHAKWQQGKRLSVRIVDLEQERSLQRNREYWGFVLRPISEQAQLEGIGATAEGWHDYYRTMFLGYEFTKVRMPGKKRPSVRRQLKSTTKLSETGMREYMEQVRAHAASVFEVTFPALQDIR